MSAAQAPKEPLGRSILPPDLIVCVGHCLDKVTLHMLLRSAKAIRDLILKASTSWPATLTLAAAENVPRLERVKCFHSFGDPASDATKVANLPALQLLDLITYHAMGQSGIKLIPSSWAKLTQLRLVCERNYEYGVPQLESPLVGLKVFTIVSSDSESLGRLLPMMPNLESIGLSHPQALHPGSERTFSVSKFLLQLRPDLKIYESNGQTMWSNVIEALYNEELIEAIFADQQRFPGNPTWLISAPGLFGKAAPTYFRNLPLPTLLKAGWNPKSRVMYLPTEKEDALLFLHRGRSTGALLHRAMTAPSGIEMVSGLIPHWADVPTSELIRTEPIHPVLAAFRFQCLPLMVDFCETRRDFDWFQEVAGAPLIFLCFKVSKSLRAVQYLVDLIKKDAELRKRFLNLLNSAHKQGTWFLLLCSLADYDRIKLLLDDFRGDLAASIDAKNFAFLKPVHYCLEKNTTIFPAAFEIDPDDYLDAVDEAQDGSAHFGMREMAALLSPGSKRPLHEEFLTQLEEVLAEGHSPSRFEWLRLNASRLKPAALHALSRNLDTQERIELSKSIVVDRKIEKPLILPALEALSLHGCDWIQSQEFIDLIYQTWSVKDLKDAGAIFSKTQIAAIPSSKAQLCKIFLALRAQHQPLALLQLLQSPEASYSQVEYAELMETIFLAYQASGTELAWVSIFATLVEKLQPVERAFTPVKRLRLASAGVALTVPVECIGSLLASLRDIDSADTPWRSLAGANACLDDYGKSISRLLVDLKLRDSTLQSYENPCPDVLLSYMETHDFRLYGRPSIEVYPIFELFAWDYATNDEANVYHRLWRTILKAKSRQGAKSLNFAEDFMANIDLRGREKGRVYATFVANGYIADRGGPSLRFAMPYSNITVRLEDL